MPATISASECYQALLDRNPAYEGLFFVGVKTTGVFCRPTCPARKPKFENCEFFETAQEALRASFRPCMRCRPLSPPGSAPEIVQTLIEVIERNPERRWSEQDLQKIAVDASTARRQFKRHFGMTFVEYSRARRMGVAMQQISAGSPVIEAQLDARYESGSGFRDAFTRITGVAPARAKARAALRIEWLETPLGTMVAVASDDGLHLLEFADRPELQSEIDRLREREEAAIVPGTAGPIRSIEAELDRYFRGELRTFKTPVVQSGTPFQRRVREALRAIPCGETRSYSDIAAEVGQPSAVRAVARASAANPLAIVVPCHRVVGEGGDLTGYGGGLARKRWLLRHESQRG